MARVRISRPGALLAVLLLAAVGAGWWIAYQRATTVEVYFVRPGAANHKEALAAVRRPAPRGPVEARMDAALRDLLAGPRKDGRQEEGDLISEIPAGTVLLGVQVGGGIVTVNLSKAYATGGGSTSMLARVWQVVYTATQFPTAGAAQILVDGHRDEALGGEGVTIGAPLRRPAIPPSF